MKITQVRNATIIVEYNNTKFLIDPWLMPKDYMPGFDTAINSEIRQPRVIHPDHWDEFAEKALDKNIKVFVQSSVDKDYVITKGFTNIEIIQENGTEYNGITLYKTGTQHGKREIIKPLCASIGMPYDAMGVVFKSEDEKTLYIAGDTIWCEEVIEALTKYHPDVIVINACAATVLNGERIIMNIEDVKNVLDAAPDAKVIASHLDTVSHLSVTREDLKEFKTKNNIGNLLIPDDGETLDFIGNN